MADIFDSDTDAAAGASAGVSSTMQALFKAQPPMPRGDATGAPPPSALFPYPDSDSDSDDGAGALGGRANARDAEIARLRVEAQGYRDALAEMEQAEEERVAQALTAARMRQVMQDTFAIECPTVDDADRVSLENLGNALYRSFQRVSLDDTRDIEALGPGWKTKSTVTPFLRPRTQVAWNSMLDTSVPVAAPPPAPPAAAAAAAAPVAPAAPARNFGYRLDGTQMTSLEDLTVQLDGGFARSEARYRTAYRVKPAYVNDASYIEYAMLRGLCALRGPHQELLADDTMLYTFPAVALRRQDAVLALSSDVLVNANDLASLQSTAIRAYTDIPASTVAGKTIDPAAPLMRAESDRRGGAVPLQDATGSPTGQEPAMEALWTPLTSENPATEQREVMFNSPSIAVCKAACLETLIVYLKSLRAKAATRSDPDQRTYAIEPALDAIIAATKLRQLKSIAEVARAGGNRAVTVRRDDAEQPMWFPRQSNSDERFITRPVLHCLVPEAVTDDEVVATSELVFPVAAGLGRLKRRDARAGDPRIPAAARFDWRAAPVEGCPGQPYTAGDMSKNLRDGMDSIRQAPRRRASDFEFYFAETTHGQPWQPGEDRRPRAFGEAVNTDPECVTLDRMSAVFANGLEGLQKLTQLERERDLLRRLEERGSVERRELFGIYENGEGGAPTPDSQRVTMEMASRNRRSAIWEQALRKLNVSGDRLLDFIKLLFRRGQRVDGVGAGAERPRAAGVAEAHPAAPQGDCTAHHAVPDAHHRGCAQLRAQGRQADHGPQVCRRRVSSSWTRRSARTSSSSRRVRRVARSLTRRSRLQQAVPTAAASRSRFRYWCSDSCRRSAPCLPPVPEQGVRLRGHHRAPVAGDARRQRQLLLCIRTEAGGVRRHQDGAPGPVPRAASTTTTR